MGSWSATRTAGPGGRFALQITNRGPGGALTDVSSLRGAPTQLNSYSNADPFGDSTASFAFPAVTAFDDLDAPDLSRWLAHYADVELLWIPVVADDGRYARAAAQEKLVSALDNTSLVVAPARLRDAAGVLGSTENVVRLFEGFIASIDFSTGPDGGQLEIQCQGALFQLDHYLQKPMYPSRPWPLEKLVAEAFAHTRKPHLRTRPLIVAFPSGWSKKVPAYAKGGATLYTPQATPGSMWTGLASRNTGSWEHALTGFVQDQLSLMITDNDCGVAPGNQWTVGHAHKGDPLPSGRPSAARQPVLQVRNRFRTPDFSVWVGAPGVQVHLAADATQSENLVYGSGTDINGQGWRNAVISDDGSRTDYLPLAADATVWPASANAAFSTAAFASEAYVTFGAGFAQTDAVTVAAQQLARDAEPGWSGTITLTTDPSPTLPRWLLRAGMTVRLQGFAGTGATGLPLHIASVEAAPMAGTVSLTVDTRYRDLLTVAESLARTRDPLNPVRMLQVNKTSVLVEDIQAPWDYSAGSGFVPTKSTAFYRHKPDSTGFPYTSWTRKYPPHSHAKFYVRCTAARGYLGTKLGVPSWRQDAPSRKARWAGPVPVLTSEKGSIARSEFFVVDQWGTLLKAPFHVSIYKVNVTAAAMPRDGAGPSPYLDGAFESVNPTTGQAWPAGNFLAPDASFLIGWGNRAAGIYNRAGFSPGSEAEQGSPTGMLFDDAGWDFDNTDQPDYKRQAPAGYKQDRRAITLWAMFYCEWPSTVYFGGRLFRQNPGVS